MVDLSQPVNYDYSADGGQVVLSISAGSSSVASSSGGFRVENVDFRRGEDGQSQIIISLNRAGANVAVSAGNGELSADIFNTDLPGHLDQRLNVVDFCNASSID